MTAIQNRVFFFFDDSGTLHRNEPSGYFVYAGYVFLGRDELDAAKRKYKAAADRIRAKLGTDEEIKAFGSSNKHKRSLYNAVRMYDSVSCVVNINKVYSCILDMKNSICRYKDYLIKRIVKNKLQVMIKEGLVSKQDDIEIKLYIDEQRTASDGYYPLEDSIYEELRHGIVNYNYGTVHPNLFSGNVAVSAEYCESSKFYMIQACDILANRILASCRDGNEKLLAIPNHLNLTFP